MKSIYLVLVLSILLFSCGDDNEESQANNGTAKPIYNQAYQENFEEDKIPDIINNAFNAYVLVDPFQEGVSEQIAAIKANNNEVGAYISIGTGEDWRDDFASLQSFLVDESWDQWNGEFFVDFVNTGIIDVMKTRIDKIADWGCDWVEFDNMDWIYDDTLRAEYGFHVTQEEGVAYYNELCNYVHEKGMKCMAKNTVDFADNFDGVLYESYNNNKNWWDTSGAQRFLDAGKLVIINHYNESSCSEVYSEYKGIYNNDLSFICEDANLQKYVHFNE